MFLWVVLKLFQVRRVPQQPKGLLKLPLEVITEVLKLLDWQPVLHTCKHLSDATKAKSIWLDLFDASNARHSRSLAVTTTP
ncbi:hypothetical protein K443DRAFT_3601 [Laccaria amethystina LaAM-08-1]|uniref:F-box domain-containing protein n=1 Tax=Laccaria amethystina LaAM-08-1 TaxID=1095629 RepID=A0A0C9XW68_9AGAR|nr:hypothetical protein K443DRAFT_3601 [Laccaria amethystina LaAM-08-1]